jgi:hypothetical protein
MATNSTIPYNTYRNIAVWERPRDYSEISVWVFLVMQASHIATLGRRHHLTTTATSVIVGHMSVVYKYVARTAPARWSSCGAWDETGIAARIPLCVLPIFAFCLSEEADNGVAPGRRPGLHSWFNRWISGFRRGSNAVVVSIYTRAFCTFSITLGSPPISHPLSLSLRSTASEHCASGHLVPCTPIRPLRGSETDNGIQRERAPNIRRIRASQRGTHCAASG